MTDLPTPTPPVNIETEPFWAATAEERLHLPHCSETGQAIWYPRNHGPDGSAVEWRDVEPVGVVYSYSIARRGQGRWKDAAPYVVAYVELDAGPRMLTNIVECDPDDVEIGMRVSAVFHPVPLDERDDGPQRSVIRFRPDPARTAP